MFNGKIYKITSTLQHVQLFSFLHPIQAQEVAQVASLSSCLILHKFVIFFSGMLAFAAPRIDAPLTIDRVAFRRSVSDHLARISFDLY